MADDQNRRARATNLTAADRSRGGQRSASIQQRDELGQFAGRRAGGESRSGRRRSQRAGSTRRSR